MRKPVMAALLGAVLLANAPTRSRAPRASLARPVVKQTAADAFLAANARVRGVLHTASGLQYRVLEAGEGTARPTDSDVALVTYVGTLTNGTVFDRSKQATPMPVAGVVPGFAEALKLMPKGARYRVWIKPSLGYGDERTGPIPPGSVLAFDIDLLDFISVEHYRQLRQQALGELGDAVPSR